MPYGMQGAELNTAFNRTGAELPSVYDLAGNEYQFVVPDPILFTDIPEYFRNDVTNALDYIDDLGDGYVNYIVVTDSHYELSTVRNTAKIFNYLYQEGRFDKLIHLGDMVDGKGFDGTGWQRLVEDDWWHFKGHWLFTQGNHDSAWFGSSLEALASYFETTKNIRYTTDSYHDCYYYDNDDYKIRIIGSHHATGQTKTTVINEYINAAVNKGYKWLSLSHYRLDANGDRFTNAADTYGNFICHISGHRHTDTFRMVTTVGNKSMLDINLEADIQGRAYAGTNQEQCITLISINPTLEKVKVYRIGLSRVYDAKQWEFDGFTQ